LNSSVSLHNMHIVVFSNGRRRTREQEQLRTTYPRAKGSKRKRRHAAPVLLEECDIGGGKHPFDEKKVKSVLLLVKNFLKREEVPFNVEKMLSFGR